MVMPVSTVSSELPTTGLTAEWESDLPKTGLSLPFTKGFVGGVIHSNHNVRHGYPYVVHLCIPIIASGHHSLREILLIITSSNTKAVSKKNKTQCQILKA